eukprot:sb/3477285/
MFVLLFLLLPVSSAGDLKSGGTSAFSGATSKSRYGGAVPSRAIDGDPYTEFHSAVSSQPQWLRLTLVRHQFGHVAPSFFARDFSRTPHTEGTVTTRALGKSLALLNGAS